MEKCEGPAPKAAIVKGVKVEEKGATSGPLKGLAAAKEAFKDGDIPRVVVVAPPQEAMDSEVTALPGVPEASQESPNDQDKKRSQLGPKEVTFDCPQVQEPSEAAPTVERSQGRRGTGFVRVEDIPTCDGEEDDEEEDEDAKQEGSPGSGSNLSGKRDSKGKKGVTFSHTVQVDGENSEEPSGQRHLGRKGTGFINLSELPDEAEEAEEGEQSESPSVSPVRSSSYSLEESSPGVPDKRPEKGEKGVTFDASVATPEAEDEFHAAVNKGRARKSTGFLSPSDMPPSDDEEDEEKPQDGGHVTFEDQEELPVVNRSKVRKGTGFVHPDEVLAPEDDEDEEERPEEETDGHGRSSSSHPGNHVTFDEGAENGITPEANRKQARKSTGFLSMRDLPDSEEEDEEEEAEEASPGGDRPEAEASGGEQDKHGKHVNFTTSQDEVGEDASPGRRNNKAVRKGTGFINLTELPASDEEEEEEAET